MSTAAGVGGTAAIRYRQRVRERPRIREATFDDYPLIAALQKRSDLGIRPFEDWKAVWSANPVYQDRFRRWPIGWVLEGENGEIGGSISSVPFVYRLGGRDLVAAAACAWAVDPAYRPWALTLLDKLSHQAEADFCITTTAGPSSEPCLSFLQWSKVPVGSWQTTAFWITDYPGFLRIALLAGSFPLSRALSYAASLGSLRRFIRHRPVPEQRPSHIIETQSGFDGSFDEFWEEQSRRNESMLLAVRSRQTLEWHFRLLLDQSRVWILTAREGPRLVAYAIFERHDNSTRGLKHVRLVDFQALEGAGQALPAILHRALEKCRQDRVHVLECTGCWLNRPGLPHTAPPYQRALPAWLYYYKTNSGELASLLAHPEVWAPSSFDGDACL